jgi:hypothetical protein
MASSPRRGIAAMRRSFCFSAGPLAALALASLACAHAAAQSLGILGTAPGGGSGPAIAAPRLAQATRAEAANPLGGGGAVELEAVPAPATPRASSRRVYACVGGGGPVTFSDRPCGPAASVRDLAVIVPDVEHDSARSGAARSSAAPAAGGRAARTPAAPRNDERDQDRAPRRSADEADSRAVASGAASGNQCDRLREAVAALDQHMRAGYSAREAGRLWTRWREAKERLRKAGC